MYKGHVLQQNTFTEADFEEINKLIQKEKNKEKKDEHLIIKLEESKMLKGLFDNGIYNNGCRFRNPW